LLRKHRNLFSYAVECLRKYRMRTIVVFIVFTFAVAMLSSVLFIKDGLEREAALSVAKAPDITVQYLRAGRLEPIPTAFEEIIAGTDGVVEVRPRIWGYIGISTNIFTLIGLDLSSNRLLEESSFEIAEGRFLSTSDAGTGRIVVGPLLVGVLQLKVGDTITLLSEAVKPKIFTVVGIFSVESSIYTADLLVTSIQDARKFFEIPEGFVTDLMIYVNPEVNVDDVAAKIQNFPNLRLLSQDILMRGLRTAYATRGGIFTTIWTVLIAAVTLIAFSQAIIVGVESRFEVGLLKTFGFTTMDIIEIRLIESLILGIFSASLGMIAGMVYAWFDAPGLSSILLGWAFLPTEFKMPTHVSYESVFSTYAITVIPLLFATVVPAWINATTDPELAMRRATA